MRETGPVGLEYSGVGSDKKRQSSRLNILLKSFIYLRSYNRSFIGRYGVYSLPSVRQSHNIWRKLTRMPEFFGKAGKRLHIKPTIWGSYNYIVITKINRAVDPMQNFLCVQTYTQNEMAEIYYINNMSVE